MTQEMMRTYIKSARVIANLLDNQFSLFGIQFGLDGIIGMVPGLGDLIGIILSLYIVWIGYVVKVPNKLLVRMLLNVGLDGLLGAVPVIGDIGDIFFKANMRNLHILESHFSYKNHLN